MHKRSFVVAIVAILLIAGMVSSAACEMACIPTTGQMAVCCAQQMRHASLVDHCKNAHVASVMSAHSCGHPQENTAVPAVSAQIVQLHATEGISAPLTALPSPNTIAGSLDIFSLASFHRSSFQAPLRI